MNRDHRNKNKNEVGVELKYCEHCGGLWVRERDAGVYCGRCETKVADLPIPTRKLGRLSLPVRSPTVVEDYDLDPDVEDPSDMEAVGGVA